jgi:hypothetical protein
MSDNIDDSIKEASISITEFENMLGASEASIDLDQHQELFESGTC